MVGLALTAATAATSGIPRMFLPSIFAFFTLHGASIYMGVSTPDFPAILRHINATKLPDKVSNHTKVVCSA
jgi:hypothetical protein